MRCGGSLGPNVGGQRARARGRVILGLRECIWNAPEVLTTFDDTGFLGSPPRRMVYKLGSTLGEYLPFPCGE